MKSCLHSGYQQVNDRMVKALDSGSRGRGFESRFSAFFLTAILVSVVSCLLYFGRKAACTVTAGQIKDRMVKTLDSESRGRWFEYRSSAVSFLALLRKTETDCKPCFFVFCFFEVKDQDDHNYCFTSTEAARMLIMDGGTGVAGWGERKRDDSTAATA